MLIASTLNNGSNEYSLVNKQYLDLFGQNCVKCAAVDISHPSANTNYRINHNLGTQNVVLSAYDVSTALNVADIAYSVPNNNNVIISLNHIPSSLNTMRVIVMGALTVTTATATVVEQNNQV